MKSLLALVFIFSSFTSLLAQKNEMPPHPGGKPYVFEEVVTLDSAYTKAKLYSNARTWFTKNFKSPTDVLQVQDKEAGELVGRGAIKLQREVQRIAGQPIYADGYLWCIMEVWVKDGRYKYNLSRFTYDNLERSTSDYYNPITDAKEFTGKGPMKKTLNSVWKVLQQETEARAEQLIASLKADMVAKQQNEF